MGALSTGFDDWTEAKRSKFDAYLLAALRTGFNDYRTGGAGPSTVSVGFTLASDATHTVALIHAFLGRCFSPAQGRLTGSHLKDLHEGGRAYVTADVTMGQLNQLASVPFIPEIQLCANLAPGRPVPRLVANPHAASATAVPFRSQKPRILGVIDHGCPFAHQAFRQSAGSEIFAIWDQDEVPDFPWDEGSTPQGLGYGRQVDNRVLSAWIHQATGAGGTDESLCYQIAQYSALRSAYTHGSLAFGLLSANWASPSLAQRGSSGPECIPGVADTIFVQLPRDVLVAPSRGSCDRSILDGVRYIVDCSPDGAEVTVMVDYGTEMGPHDGSSWFERAIDAIVDAVIADRGIKLKIVFPSGNSHDRKRRAVVLGIPRADGAATTLGWGIPRSNDAPSTLEIWMDAAHSGLQFEVAIPGTTRPAIALASVADAVVAWPASGEALFAVVVRRHGTQIQVLIQTAPTNLAGPGRRVAPAGVWTLSFKPAANMTTAIDVYTCWGGRNPGMPQRLWPSKFIARANQAVIVTGDGSIMGSGCGNETLMVGGNEKWGQSRRADYSSGGEARGGKRKNVVCGADWVAITEESPSLPGLLTLGTRSASRVRARGTSFAVPQVARTIVETGALPHGHPPPTSTFPGTVNKVKKRKEYFEPRI